MILNIIVLGITFCCDFDYILVGTLYNMHDNNIMLLQFDITILSVEQTLRLHSHAPSAARTLYALYMFIV